MTSRFPSALGKSLGRRGCTTQYIPPLGSVRIQYHRVPSNTIQYLTLPSNTILIQCSVHGASSIWDCVFSEFLLLCLSPPITLFYLKSFFAVTTQQNQTIIWQNLAWRTLFRHLEIGFLLDEREEDSGKVILRRLTSWFQELHCSSTGRPPEDQDCTDLTKRSSVLIFV